MIVDLHVKTVGEGDPVVLIPGLGYASWYWQPQNPLGADRKLLRVDPRGAGKSPKPDGPYSIGEMALDVARVIEETGSPAHVVGHSMGGYLAQSLVVQRPDLVRSLTLVSTTCGGPEHVPVPDDTMTAWMAEAGKPPDQYARATMPLSLRLGWPEQHPDAYEELLHRRLSHPTPPENWQHQFAACEAFLDAGLDVGSITAPTLVVHGGADRVVPVENALLLKKTINEGRLIVFEESGHLVSLEEPEAFNAAVDAFWKEAA